MRLVKLNLFNGSSKNEMSLTVLIFVLDGIFPLFIDRDCGVVDSSPTFLAQMSPAMLVLINQFPSLTHIPSEAQFFCCFTWNFIYVYKSGLYQGLGCCGELRFTTFLA